MATTTEMLLPQLVEIWLPNHDATLQESSTESSEQVPASQIPPFIKFVDNLPDIGERDNRHKRLPCGHSASLSWILEGGNFLGGTISQPGPHFLGCAQQGCNEWMSCPTILDPWALDGLQMRLTLIQWSWNKDARTEADRITVSLLRDILSKTGYLTQDPEPAPEPELEPKAEGQLSGSAASESSLMRTLVDVELEAFTLREQNMATSAETPFDSEEPYCSYRAAEPHNPSTRYPMQSLGQLCQCVTPHVFQRAPSDWGLGLTPAETVSDPKGRKEEKRKTVRFLAPVVTEVQYFDKWWKDEYRDSGRYWSTGPHTKSTDLATQADDDLEIERLEHPERFLGRRASEVDGPESANWFSDDEDERLEHPERFLGRRASEVDGPESANWFSDDEDEGDELVAEMEREMERAGEALDKQGTWDENWEDEETYDDDILDEMKGAEESGDEKVLVDDKKDEGEKKDEDDKMDEDENALDEVQKGRDLWNESWDESIEDLKKRYESWEDMF